ncbi:MAG: NF038132 family protein [Propionivibrio sp.]
MSNRKSNTTKLAVVASAVFSVFMAGEASATAFDGGIPAGWTGVGNYGTLGANGVVTTSPEGGNYGWVSTAGGASTLGANDLNIGDETNGSLLRSGVFSAAAGDSLNFYFNYVTSDGSSYIEYAWARLLDAALNPVALLFTARTTPTGDTVPGFGLPPIEATIIPTSTPIIPGGPSWSALGGSSGDCWLTGCGYTGWIESEYTIANAGNYILEFGVVNWADTAFDSGMAFDGITVGGVPIDPNGEVPEPATLALVGLGLAGLGALRRRKVAV